jgi:maltokinase
MNPRIPVKSLDTEARWFGGKGRTVASLEEAGALQVDGGALTLADVTYSDGHPERYLLLEQPPWAALLDTLGEGPRDDGRGGFFELRGDALDFHGLAGEHVPSTDQTNTLVALGERVLVKAYRRLEPGMHPEVELLTVLTRARAPVPALLGSVHHVDARGRDTTLALLQRFVPGTEAGWEDAIVRVAEHLRGERDAPLDEYALAANAGRRVHEVLAAELGTSIATAADASAARRAAERALTEAAHRDEELARATAAVARGLAALDALEGARLQRIHGDLHYAQFLRPLDGNGDVRVIDFEGDPGVPLAERRRPGSPLHDLACLLRSIDHIGSAASRRAAATAPDAWITAARAAALEAYGPADPHLLRGLELAKECGEFLYAQRVLPEWTYAPRLGLERMLAEEPA